MKSIRDSANCAFIGYHSSKVLCNGCVWNSLNRAQNVDKFMISCFVAFCVQTKVIKNTFLYIEG